jgi:hypothetical protein
MPFLEETLRNRFTYHKPDGSKPIIYEKLRSMCLDLVLYINEVCPDCRELSVAITKIEEANMWMNAAIARYPEKDKKLKE